MSADNQASVDQFNLPHPSGEGFLQISVARAALHGGAETAPVLFVMDADFEFAMAAEIAKFKGLGGIRPTPMVVGIGYGVSDVAAFSRLRTADLTTPLSAANRVALGDLADALGDRDGGAEGLLRFMVDTLTPEILARYPEASRDDHILFGHSLGGLFTVYALLTRPDAFAAFLATSPALYWNDFSILSHLPAFSQKHAVIARKPRVFLACGGQEQDPLTWLPKGSAMTLEQARTMIASCRMIDAMGEFATALGEAGLTELVSVVFEDEEHVSVVPAAMTRGLNFAVPNPG